MSNFKINFEEPYTTFDNKLLQGETVFKNSAQKLCYLYLYSYARAKAIFPSMPKIAAAICSSPRNAMRVIEQLEEMGFIEIEKQAGKSNQYGLNNYFEVAEKLTRDKLSPVESPINLGEKEEIISDQSTRDKLSPVTNCHDTSDKLSLVEPKPVTNCHPITSTIKTINKNSSSLASTSPDFSKMELIDKNLKNLFPLAPFDELKAKMLEEAEEGKRVIKTEKQYQGLLRHRLSDWTSSSKPSEIAQIRKKKPIRTEYIPEHFGDEFEPKQKPESDNELEKRKMILNLKLRLSRNEITKEEYEQGIAILE